MPLITVKKEKTAGLLKENKIIYLKKSIVELAKVKDALEFFYKENTDGTVAHNKLNELTTLKTFFGGSFSDDIKTIVENKDRLKTTI